MKELLLDAETLYTREQLHDVLIKVCGFPADYGRNLDALYDCLTEAEEMEIEVQNREQAQNYFLRIWSVLLDAAKENEGLRLIG